MRNSWIAGLGAVCVTAGVGSFVALGPGAEPAGATDALPRFGDCQQLRDWYVREALPHVGPWGLVGGRYSPADAPRGVAEDTAQPDRAATGSMGAAGNGGTGTNVQEQGVDEPDLAKTNGTIAVVVHDGRLVVSDVTGDEPRELA
ncbi:MAG: beta-propeller domain-containing protein, partial [Nocardioidaceae bacterium]